MLLPALLVLSLPVAAQRQLQFLPAWGATPLPLGAAVAGDSLTINRFRFYVSRIELLKKGNVVWRDSLPARLLDAEGDLSVVLPRDIDADSLGFAIGVDSALQVAGAMPGDLDPDKGMYWSWQSGYIDLKLEGRRGSRSFQYHIGGYRAPYATLRRLRFALPANEGLRVLVDLARLTRGAGRDQIMSPGAAAAAIADQVPEAFHLNPAP